MCDKLQILIIDDSKTFVIKLKRVLEQSHSNVVQISTCDNPKQAIRDVRGIRFDIVFVDDVFQESNMNGRDILHAAPTTFLTHYILISGRKLIVRVNPLCSDILSLQMLSKRDINKLFIYKLISAIVQKKKNAHIKSRMIKELQLWTSRKEDV